MDRRVLIVFGVAAILAFTIGGAALIVSCSTQTNESSQTAESSQRDDEDTQTNEAANEVESDQGDEDTQARGHAEELSLVIRISGTEGTSYQGIYRMLPEGQPLSIDGTLDEPYIDYEAEGDAEDFRGVQAVFQKTRPGDEGNLKVQLLSDQLLAENKTSALEGYKVLAENETSAEEGVVEVSWFP